MKVALVGCGSRHQMFRNALTGPYADRHELVALCDSNPYRLSLSAAAVAKPGTNGIATYLSADFDRMLAEQGADTVLISTPDNTHAGYIVRALEAGCDVICEKPMTIDLPSLRQILAAQDRTGRKVRVAFNYRYAPARQQIRALLAAGTIGTVTGLDFRWHLDQVHGSDYFRRWHRDKANSGGLFVHKATHHFDLMNWWLGTTPAAVSASGGRHAYSPVRAVELGLVGHGPRCTGCPVALRCPYPLDLDADKRLAALYRDAEAEDGYHRDQCIFSPEITLEDTLQAQIRFANGATANYSLTAYAPWEGLEVMFYGTGGQLSHRHVEVHGVFGGKRPKEKQSVTTTLHLAGQDPTNLAVPKAQGDHGGADPLMLQDIFGEGGSETHASDHRAGAWSILAGIAANAALASGQVEEIGDFLAQVGIARI